MLRSSFGLASALVVLLVGCGGSVSSVGSSSGASGGGTSGNGGSSGSSGDSPTCTVQTLRGDRACVPGTARANTPITIAVDASEGCLGCFTTFEPCSVTVSGDRITVAMATRTCPPAGDVGCPAICVYQATTCTLPALGPGSYTVDVVGDTPRAGLPPRQLVVAPDATALSCTLPAPSDGPAPLDNSYPKECGSDGDCAVATVGNVCSPCRCPNAAIASSAKAAYEADYRAATSQCPASDAQVKCAACQERKATCMRTAPGSASGICMLAP